MTRLYSRTGPIECRVTHQSDDRWFATARRGSGQEGRIATAYAPGPAQAAQEAVANLVSREAEDAREEAEWDRLDAVQPAYRHHPTTRGYLARETDRSQP